ncbi:TPA: microcompartment protein PduM [Klebsiella pneumoniae]|uniref:microcompartment protein PduM n=1 Tax=Klebsiella TaxID=570 RepID=UPI0003BF38D0|nr:MULTISPECIES: microcompartment protein PduM [Klebsiella]EIX9156894.1 microcompartment protein PduM [Klebsiella pneumoniae]EKD8976980.1 microcompartment protein PduM [Klebsiella pneumoniae]EKZ6090426.1 microcompartment protein PduM [Klebsiella pneumoniae]ELA0907535.1 microcompartment protein PduM [Klebsiella pneumoniae]ELA1036430.1 microcompartment protein PduM [Klebsiella pneumoniae]
MNHAMLQRIVEEVAARLRHRALSTATLSVAQLGEADIRSLLCQHASLRIVQVDLPLLEQLAGQRALAAAGCALHEAMAWGVRVQLTLLPAQLPALAVKKLARLPLTFSDPLGQPVRLHAASVLTYADVAHFSGGYLVLRRRPIITALAREAAVARHVQLIKQE